MPKVIMRFRDIDHNNHIYEEGDTYPAEGFEANAERISFLTKRHPTYGVAFLVSEAEEKKNEDYSDKPEETEKGTKKANPKKKTSTKK